MDERRQSEGLSSVGSLWYALPPVALAWNTPDLRGLSLVIVPLFAWSWLQDWVSCEIANTYHGGRLALFDLLTACNYIALARGLEQGGHASWRLSDAATVHWGLIFVIYIAWNLRMAKESTPSTRRMLWRYSATEVGAVALAAALYVYGPGASLTAYLAIAMALVALHTGLLLAWRRSSREPKRQRMPAYAQE